MGSWDLDADLEALRTQRLYRRLRTIEGPEEPEVVVDGRPAILLCSNNYLGLANHPEVVAAAREVLERYGAGSGSSRLISGHLRIHADLEERIAEWKGAEAAIVFSSGYHANLGVLQALVGAGDAILSDELNHASLIDGCRLSRAEVRVYRHGDPGSLEEALRATAGARRRLVVTDSVFSMDGDRAPLAAICEVAERHGAEVMVDEAHATGLCGATGAGLVEELGLRDRVLVQMGTLGKALGSFGAYVAGRRSLVELLVNRARTFIFTTALPPATVGAAGCAIDIVRREPERRSRVAENARMLRERLVGAGYRVPPVESPILPVMIGESGATMRLCERLLDKGVFAQGIRPPTVPPGTSRLRVTVMATHGAAELDRAARAFEAAIVEER
ncbi:MAG: 8-amino-7-oxononanoate synthase [Candidatus Binatia bacterium]